jgi:DNA-binding beta-propeller fold protein YncE
VSVVGSPIAVGGFPFGVAVTPDGSKVYVANDGSGTVSLVHLRKLRKSHAAKFQVDHDAPIHRSHRPSANNAINKFYESRRAGNCLPLAFRRAAVASTWFA